MKCTILTPFERVAVDDSAKAAREQERRALLDEIRTIAKQCGVDADTLEQVWSSDGRTLGENVLREIAGSDLVIAVLVGNSPTVYWECGFAFGLATECVLIVEPKKSHPFAISRFRTITVPDMARQLPEAIKSIINHASEPTGAHLGRRLLEHFGARRHEVRGLERLHAKKDIGVVVRRRSDDDPRALVTCIGQNVVLEAGRAIVRNLKRSGFCTLYVPALQSWVADRPSAAERGYLYDLQSKAARLDITRVYFVDRYDQTVGAAFRDRVRADRDKGIRTLYVAADCLPTPPAPFERIRDFGLWDDTRDPDKTGLVCEVQYTNGDIPQIASCMYTTDASSVEEARGWREYLLQHARPAPWLRSEEELLEATFEGQFRLASGVDLASAMEPAIDLGASTGGRCIPANNAASGADGVGLRPSCAAYHAPWQLLRRCNVVSTPAWHEPFYQESFHQWLREHGWPDGARRPLDVLICGLADWGMLYHLLQAVHASDPAAISNMTVHVLDACESPIASCKALIRELRMATEHDQPTIHYHVGSILDPGLLPRGKTFDLISSDAFLSRFAPTGDERPRATYGGGTRHEVMRRWIELLSRDGCIVTTVRVRKDVARGASHDDLGEADRRSFVIRAVEQGAKRNMPRDLVAHCARWYANFIRSLPFIDDNALDQFLQEFAADVRWEAGYLNPIRGTDRNEYEMIPRPLYAKLVLHRRG